MIKKIEELISRVLEKFFVTRIAPYISSDGRSQEIKDMIGTDVAARKEFSGEPCLVSVVSSGYIVHHKDNEILYSEFVTDKDNQLYYIEKE